MIRRRAGNRLPAVALALLLVGGIRTAPAWSGLQHIHIGKAAARNVPDEMTAFRAFARPMALPSIYPDLWKETDLDEVPRHYFELDRLPPGADPYALSPSLAQALPQLRQRIEDVGSAPWTILDLLGKMTAAMRTNDWLWAARCGAAMSHYVGDLHMPLHCTRNYNGQETGQAGIHGRIENEMVRSFFEPRMIHPGPAVYLDDPFRETLGWAAQSAALVPGLLRADLVAKRSANGRFDTERYYLKLWELTGDTIVRQIGDAASHLSSLWYTAWIDAGRPPIPAPFAELPSTSVHSGVGIDPTLESRPVAARSAQDRRYDIIIWSVMGAMALVVVASSLYRGVQVRRAARK